MHKFNIQSEISVCETDELSPLQRDLLLRAKAACNAAYAPYSRFRVGAALLLEDGTVVVGSNQENAAYPLTLCAERVAIFAAMSQKPDARISHIAITVQTQTGAVDRPVSPCGSCRQVIYETELRCKRDIELILQGDTGSVYLVPTVKHLLPLMFDASFLDKK